MVHRRLTILCGSVLWFCGLEEKEKTAEQGPSSLSSGYGSVLDKESLSFTGNYWEQYERQIWELRVHNQAGGKQKSY